MAEKQSGDFKTLPITDGFVIITQLQFLRENPDQAPKDSMWFLNITPFVQGKALPNAETVDIATFDFRAPVTDGAVEAIAGADIPRIDVDHVVNTLANKFEMLKTGEIHSLMLIGVPGLGYENFLEGDSMKGCGVIQWDASDFAKIIEHVKGAYNQSAKH